jgi:hypothetical protein
MVNFIATNQGNRAVRFLSVFIPLVFLLVLLPCVVLFLDIPRDYRDFENFSIILKYVLTLYFKVTLYCVLPLVILFCVFNVFHWTPEMKAELVRRIDWLLSNCKIFFGYLTIFNYIYVSYTFLMYDYTVIFYQLLIEFSSAFFLIKQSTISSVILILVRLIVLFNPYMHPVNVPYLILGALYFVSYMLTVVPPFPTPPHRIQSEAGSLADDSHLFLLENFEDPQQVQVGTYNEPFHFPVFPMEDDEPFEPIEIPALRRFDAEEHIPIRFSPPQENFIRLPSLTPDDMDLSDAMTNFQVMLNDAHNEDRRDFILREKRAFIDAYRRGSPNQEESLEEEGVVGDVHIDSEVEVCIECNEVYENCNCDFPKPIPDVCQELGCWENCSLYCEHCHQVLCYTHQCKCQHFNCNCNRFAVSDRGDFRKRFMFVNDISNTNNVIPEPGVIVEVQFGDGGDYFTVVGVVMLSRVVTPTIDLDDDDIPLPSFDQVDVFAHDCIGVTYRGVRYVIYIGKSANLFPPGDYNLLLFKTTIITNALGRQARVGTPNLPFSTRLKLLRLTWNPIQPEMNQAIRDDLREIRVERAKLQAQQRLNSIFKDPLGFNDVIARSVEAVSDISSNLLEFVSVTERNVVEAISEFSDSVKVVRDKGVILNHNVGQYDFIEGLMEKINDPYVVLSLGAILCMVAYWSDSKLAKLSTLALVGGYVYKKFGSKSAIMEFFDKIKEICSCMFEVSPEADWSVMKGPLDLIIDSILGFQYARVFKDSAGKEDFMTEFNKNLKTTRGSKQSLTDMIDYFVDIITKFIRFLGAQLGRKDLTSIGLAFPKVGEIGERVTAFIDKSLERNYMDITSYNELKSLQSEIRHVRTTIPVTRDNTVYTHALDSYEKMLLPIASNFARNNIGTNGYRQVPLGFMFAGPSQHGKSNACDQMIIELIMRCADKVTVDRCMANTDDVIFNYQYESEFFEGYYGQWAVKLDEMGALKDVPGTPDNCFFGSLRMINSSKYIMNMAHLDLKGNNEFMSLLVGATTNMTMWLNNSVNFIEPIDNRYIVFLSCLKLEFTTGEGDNPYWDRVPDIVKLANHVKLAIDKEGKEVATYDQEVWEFRRYSLLEGKVIDTTPLSFEGVANLLEARFNFLAGDCLKRRSTIISRKEELYEKRFGKKFSAEADYFDTWREENEARVAYFSQQLGLTAEVILECTEGMDAESITSAAIMRVYRQKYIHPLKRVAEDVATGLRDFIYQHPFATITTALGILGTIWYLTRSVIASEGSGRLRTVTRTRKRVSAVRGKKAARRMQAEAPILTQNTRDVVKAVRSTNWFEFIVSIHINNVLTPRKLGFAIFLYDRVAATPKHFFDVLCDALEMDPECTLTLKCVGNEGLVFEMFVKDVLPEDEEDDTRGMSPGKDDETPYEEDLYIWNFPPAVKRRTNILHHLRHSTDSVLCRPFGGCILSWPDSKKELDLAAIMFSPITGNYYDYHVNKGFKYNFTTYDALCGALLFSIDSYDSKQVKLIGIHTAGDKHSMGMGVGVFTDYLDSALELYPPIETPLLDIKKECAPLDPQFEVVQGEISVTLPYRTQLKRTPLYGCIGKSNNVPAKLRPWKNEEDELINPLQMALNKYGKPLPALHDGLLRKCAVSCFNRSMKACHTDDFEFSHVLSFEEAVVGCYDYKGVNLNGAVGLTFSQLGFKKKRELVGGLDGYNLENSNVPLVRKQVEADLEKIKTGKDPMWKNKIFPKDELLDLEKILKGKLRGIWSEEFSASIIIRMYFGAFIAWMQRNKIKNRFGLGVNVNGPDFNILARTLIAMAESGAFGDFKNYDGTHRLQVALAYCRHYVNAWYKMHSPDWCPEHDRIRERLVELITIPLLVYSGLIFWVANVMPSGSSVTTPFNNLRNEIEAVYNVVRIVENSYEVSQERIDEINELIAAVFYGDDNVIFLSRCLGDIDMKMLSDGYAVMGLVYTDDRKGTDYRLKKLIEGSFLNCDFYFDGAQFGFISLLAKQSIMDMLYFSKHTITLDELCLNVKQAIFHLARRPGTKIEDIVRLAQLARKEYNFVIDVPLTLKDLKYASFRSKLEYI